MKHPFLARTRSPVADCRWCGEPHKHQNHILESTYEAWETAARRNAEDMRRARPRTAIPVRATSSVDETVA